LVAFREFHITRVQNLAEALHAHGLSLSAVAQGRIFVDGVRTSLASTVLQPGACVRVGEVVQGHDYQGIDLMLHESVDVLVANKPAGLSSIPDTRGTEASLLGLLERTHGKLHASSRLDREVSGVLVFARTEAAALALTQARETSQYRRLYLALAHGNAVQDSFVWDADIGRAKNKNLRAINGHEKAQALSYARTLARIALPYPVAALTALALEPQTGRTHQLRLHASHAGLPLLGDTAYGGPKQLTLARGKVVPISRIMLHAFRVTTPFGVFESPVPTDFRDLWSMLGASATTPEAQAVLWENPWNASILPKFR
jgi:23S rRNA-/tRNA-specific pseudouridylate synthase